LWFFQPLLSFLWRQQIRNRTFCHFNSKSSGLPEVAWTGKTEKDLKAEGIEYEVGKFPWAASGRSLSIGRSEGVSKALLSQFVTSCSTLVVFSAIAIFSLAAANP
jgi:hypothetical protein